MLINQLWHTDCVHGLQQIAKHEIALVVTSSPWDNIFAYGGQHCVMDWITFETVVDELWRVVAPGGIVCWDVADGIEDGHLSGTVARQTVYFLDKGFWLHEKLTIHKNGRFVPTARRHGAPAEEVLVFSKGKPSTVRRRQKPNLPENVGKRFRHNKRNKDGSTTRGLGSIIKEYGYRNSIWCYNPLCPACGYEWDGTETFTTKPSFAKTDPIKRYSIYQRPYHFSGAHPARMSRTLVGDLILAYSSPGQLVLDPFMGTGTTCEQALLNYRFYLGMEIWDTAFKIAQKTIDEAKKLHFRSLQ